MRAFGGIAAAVLAALSAPLAAQESDASSPAFSPEEDLDCAIYIGALMAETQVEMTPESRVALSSAFTYFIGRYEAQRGQDLTRALQERYAVYQTRNPQEVEQTCSIRARGFAARMQDAGRVLAQSRPPVVQPTEPPPDEQ